MAAITRLSVDGYGARRAGSFANKAGAAVTVAGYDYGTRKKPKRRKVIIDGLTYFVTPQEEAALLQKFIDSIERKAETLEPKPQTKRAAKKLKAVANKALLPDELQQRLERLKIHQALIAEESAREAAHLKATIEAIEGRNREARAALLRRYDEEAIALILAVA